MIVLICCLAPLKGLGVLSPKVELTVELRWLSRELLSKTLKGKYIHPCCLGPWVKVEVNNELTKTLGRKAGE